MGFSKTNTGSYSLNKTPSFSRTRHDPATDRDQWGSKVEFLLSCIGYCVGLGNVWRFPYMAAENGGGVFLIPYAIMLLCTGIPIFYLEMAMGQYSGKGVLSIWEFLPCAKGIGWAMILVNTLICVVYNVIIAYSFYYFFYSFLTPLPWARLNDSLIGLNATNLTEISTPAVSIPKISIFNTSIDTILNQTSKSPAFNFWYIDTLETQKSAGLHDIGLPIWDLTICNFLAWVLCFCCLIKGIKSSGKVVYFTATFPYFVLIALFCFGIVQPGAMNGIKWYLTPDWSKLWDGKVWIAAATQIFYSLGVALGGLMTMASYNKFDNNFARDTLIVTVGNCLTSVFAGFVIFSIIGNMAYKMNEPDISVVAKAGPGLAFIAYPQALSMLPFANFWSVIFFGMLITLGMDSQHPCVETILTALSDEYPSLKNHHKKLLFTICFTLFLLGIPLTSHGGLYWFTLLNDYAANLGFMLIALCLLFSIFWIFGNMSVKIGNFDDLVKEMIGTAPGLYYKVCWWVLSPVLLIGIAAWTISNYQVSKIGVNFEFSEIHLKNTDFVTFETENFYHLPSWGKIIAYMIDFSCVFVVIIYAVVHISMHGWEKSVKPSSLWKSQKREIEARMSRRIGVLDNSLGLENDAYAMSNEEKYRPKNV
jgi:solute carrier family 6 amino acid transporter-like protein 5/7/9/14